MASTGVEEYARTAPPGGGTGTKAFNVAWIAALAAAAYFLFGKKR